MNLVFILSMVIQFFIVLNLEATDKFERYEFEHKSMGTLFRIVCFGEDREVATLASREAFDRIDELNIIMSDYLPDSELNILCRQSGSGKFIPVSNELFYIITQSLKWSELSEGTFDITIGAFSKLWRRAGRKEEYPGRDKIANASEKVGYKLIELDSPHQSVKLTVENMHLDLGGIAKGFAVDEVIRIFKKYNIDHILVDGGGDISAGNPPPGKEGWKIIIENIDEGLNYVLLANQSIATSGDLYRFIEIDGQRYSHIIDPFSGFGIKIPRVVTTIADDCTTADAVASILSIMGPDKGFEFLNSLREVSSIIVQDENDTLKNYIFGEIDIRK